MRFTSADPLSSPFNNLFHYSGYSPGRSIDPDGLFAVDPFEIGGTRTGDT
ncbi:MAG: hypothetical protein KDB90_05850 [Planctomycetes bacterium]|nr:hypothetical protein [Planctomycetota bacterium]